MIFPLPPHGVPVYAFAALPEEVVVESQSASELATLAATNLSRAPPKP